MAIWNMRCSWLACGDDLKENAQNCDYLVDSDSEASFNYCNQRPQQMNYKYIM